MGILKKSWPLLLGAALVAQIVTGAELTAPGPEPPQAAQSPTMEHGALLREAGYSMIRLPAGSYTMGSPPSEPGRNDDETQHEVTLSHGFSIGATEVTARLWQRAMGNLPQNYNKGDPAEPVHSVSWFEAVDFCNRLSLLEGYEPAYTDSERDPSEQIIREVRWNAESRGYRLPTEAEWEYAARAGDASSPWAGSSKPQDVAWFDMKPGSAPSNVARKKPNALGLYDMSGDLWEWVWDHPGPYAGPATDPCGADHGFFRILRGGSRYLGAREARVAMRGWSIPHASDVATGLRIARSLDE